MPMPSSGQTKEEYIKEFMGNQEMVDKYPDEKQRYAVAISEWENKDKKMEQDLEVFALDKSSDEIKPIVKEQWIKVFPRGEYYIEKLNRKLDFNDQFFNKLNDAFESQSLSKPFIDKNHEFQDSFGDILQLEKKTDGLFCKVKLNKSGVEIVKDRKYKYISPAWGKTVDINGKEYEAKLKAVSLTNFPALEGALPEIQSQIELSNTVLVGKYKVGGKRMEILEKIALIVCNDVTLSNDSNHDMLLSKIETLKSDKEKAEKSAIELSKEIQSIKTESLKAEALNFCSEQVKLGKMHPAIQEIALNRFIANKEEIIKEYSLIPGKQEKTLDQTMELSGVKLTEEDLVMMKKLDYDSKNPDDVKQYKIHYLDKKKGGK